MKKQLFIYMTVGALSWTAPVLMAQSTNNASTTDSQAQHKQDRQELLRIVGLTRADLKDLSPEDRKAKVKEAVETKVSELKKLKADGPITPAQEQDLAFLQSHAGHHKKAAAAGSQ
jgi:hypothetical protein